MAELTSPIAPVVIALSRAGQATAERVAREIGATVHGRVGRVDTADAWFDNALDHVRALFAARTPVIGVCAAGILIRAVAPLLSDKTVEPPVVAVAEDGSAVVPLLGGHRGANRLAKRIGEALSAPAQVTTAGDLALGVALDEPPPGWRVIGAENAKAVMAGLLAGEAFQMLGDAPWLAAIGDLPNVHRFDEPPHSGDVTLRHQDDPAIFIGFAARRHVLGVGCARGCSAAELSDLARDAMAEAAIPAEALCAVVSLDLKADEVAVNALALDLNAPARFFDAVRLEEEAPRLANPSEIVFAEVGCHGVAEGAALAAAGPDGQLVVEKRKSANATVAIASAPSPITRLPGRARGRVSLIGIGPGKAEWRTPEASRLVAEADDLVGYGLYIDLLGALAAGKPRHDFPLGGEEDRCRFALEKAAEGRNVAIICSGDAGIYAMGALVFELMDTGAAGGPVTDAARRVSVVSAPGVSALQGAAALAGAPLGHDFCAISLSDLLTPRVDIIRRLKAAAEGDFVIAFYNPVSRRRRTLLTEARDILLQRRPPETPVLLASNLGRPEQRLVYRRLADLEVDEVDMLTVVLVGSSQSRLAETGDGPRMYTPRGYAAKKETVG